MVSRTSETPAIVVIREDPGQLGIARMVISLFMGNTGAIDMDRFQVYWNRKGGSENIRRTSTSPSSARTGLSQVNTICFPARPQILMTGCSRMTNSSSRSALQRVFSHGAQSLSLLPDGVAMPPFPHPCRSPRIQPVMNLG